jgi:large subunit ribosomal protein L21
MFAVVKTGGKQYKVSPNNIIEVEKLEAEVGATILLNEVVLFNDGTNAQVGKPTVEGVAVSAEVLNQKKGEKVIIFKKKRRHNYRRKNGHRQLITVLKIAGIGKGLSAKSAPAKVANAADAAKATKNSAGTKKSAEKKPAAKTADKKTTKTTKAKKAE